MTTNMKQLVCRLQRNAVIAFGLLSLLQATHLTAADTPHFAPVNAELIRTRDGLGNVLEKLRADEQVSIAYLGGSITAAPS